MQNQNTQTQLPVEPKTALAKAAFHWKRLFGEINAYDSILWEKTDRKNRTW